MRRSTAISAMALLAATSLVLGACSAGTDSSTGGGVNQQDAKPREIGGEDKVYKRPTVPDMGELTTTTEEGPRNYQNMISATNSGANLITVVALQPSVYIGVVENGAFEQQIDGDLMESVKVTSTNPQTIEYKFQKAAVWEDGAPIGCKEIYLQFLVRGEETGKKFTSASAGYQDIKEVRCTDDNKTATVVFDKPYADYRGLFSYTGNNSMLPAHIFERNAGIPDITKLTRTSPELVTEQAINAYTKDWLGFKPENAISGGPFKIKSSDSRDVTVLVRNEKYWGPKAAPSQVTIRTNTNAQSASQQLQNKEIQVVDTQADAPTAIQLKQIPSIKLIAQGGQTYEHIDFNMARPLFKDNPELRKAVATCVDRQAIVNNLVKDIDANAKPLGNVMFMPNEVGYEDHYAGVGEGNVAEAKKVMEAGGWTLGGDGIYTKGGTRAEFTLSYKTLDRRHKSWQLISQKCKEAGIQINSGQKDKFHDGELQRGQFDAALFAWLGALNKSNFSENYFSKDKGGEGNYNSYSNAQVDTLLAAANSNLDYPARVKQLNDVDKLMAADLHTIPLFQVPDMAATEASIGVCDSSGKASDVTFLNFQGGPTWDMWAWCRR
ncbi:ABC transporter family substrate-binding protein [Kibdelosporangium philippinense]|uniref:ABC transporter family substrate-binding protein n=1 Tax=Kibdelosporangium philippinense TaxID=211113 RepID=A0ABS8ZL23_9PSEU|nr:ABC transporter family substrate-binding protein [Kibdelosporangium philippinense]MCE7008506.1 ABC transporter family substrate-binding protein [Kibdelosporangium philippinense]